MSETPIFVTRYAISSGILERRAHEIEANGRAWYRREPNSVDGGMVSKDGYALTREEAVKQAETMKAKKLASLRKQIAKLEAMTFA